MAQFLNLNDHVRANCAGDIHAAAEHITLTDAVVLGGAFGDAQVVNLVFNVEAVQGGGLLRGGCRRQARPCGYRAHCG